MIDFHTHIIPNIDDGSKSVEETFNLIKEAEKVGFDKIIATSHYKPETYEVDKSERNIWIQELNKAFIKQDIKVELFLGCENYISSDLVNLIKNNKACTINNTTYILFELPLKSEEPANLNDIIYEILANKMIPILAHPERYKFIQNDPNIVYDLIEKGVLMQLNYGSFIGQYGEWAMFVAKKMLANNMVHFLGTDVHKQNTIYKYIPRVINVLNRLVDEKNIERITTINPSLVLENKKIEIEEPTYISFTWLEKLKYRRKKKRVK